MRPTTASIAKLYHIQRRLPLQTDRFDGYLFLSGTLVDAKLVAKLDIDHRPETVMVNYPEEVALLVDLEQRHDDLLTRLDELDRRVAEMLLEWQGGGKQPLDVLQLQVA